MSWKDRFPKQKKIAVVGRCPNTMHLAPYDDPDWQVWICNGAGSTGQAPRYDVCFDTHEHPWATFNAHRHWLRTQPADKLIVLGRTRGECKNELALPRQDLIAECGDLFTSSVAWMLGAAIALAPDEIGIWGVEMGAASEYGKQRDGLFWLMGQIRGRGIKLTLPEQCWLLKAPQYCFTDTPWYPTAGDDKEHKV